MSKEEKTTVVYPYFNVSYSCKYCGVPNPKYKVCEFCHEVVHTLCMDRHKEEVHPEKVLPPDFRDAISCKICPNFKTEVAEKGYAGCEAKYVCKKWNRLTRPHKVCDDHPNLKKTEGVAHAQGKAQMMHFDGDPYAPEYDIPITLVGNQIVSIGDKEDNQYHLELEEGEEYTVEIRKVIIEEKKDG